MHNFCKLITFLTPTRFGVCPRYFQGVLDCFLQHIKMTYALTDSNITVFAQNSLWKM